MNPESKKLEELYHRAELMTEHEPENFTSAFAALIIKECAKHNDDMRARGFIPTGYSLFKHFGL